jgi:hypothetical protein
LPIVIWGFLGASCADAVPDKIASDRVKDSAPLMSMTGPLHLFQAYICLLKTLIFKYFIIGFANNTIAAPKQPVMQTQTGAARPDLR